MRRNKGNKKGEEEKRMEKEKEIICKKKERDKKQKWQKGMWRNRRDIENYL